MEFRECQNVSVSGLQGFYLTKNKVLLMVVVLD